MTEENILVQQLFRQEFSKMVAVISRLFGLDNIEIAEDIVGDTFLQATESWAKDKIPVNPSAWLYTVAKQKTLYYFRRNKIYTDKIFPHLIKNRENTAGEFDIDFSACNITDSQLRMMFAICDPVIASESQIGLALRILCGFGIDEIAEAFLSNKETINKRLSRAKEKLRTAHIKLEFPDEHEIAHRLDNVLHIIYLLFNEGYHSATKNQVLQKDFCLEAMQLGIMLTKYDRTNLPKTNALIALMCYHASRFEAREKEDNAVILYDQQDETLWNKELIAKGSHYLELAASGEELSTYHLEAGIAFWHCQKEDSMEKWRHILQHYDLLLRLNYSPVIALNRLYALYKVSGKEKTLPELLKLDLNKNHYYYTLLGELYAGIDNSKAKESFERAMELTKTQKDWHTIQAKMKAKLFYEKTN